MSLYIDHCAVLVTSIEDALAKMPAGCIHGKIHTYISEGTREVYVHHPESDQGRILLMQAVSEGPYQRAMQKRGPGLHHICIRVENIQEFIEEICSSGFLLHPKSLASFSHGVVYLCRPGIPFLVEVENLTDEQRESHIRPGLVSAVTMPIAPENARIVESVFKNFVTNAEEFSLTLNASEPCRVKFI